MLGGHECVSKVMDIHNFFFNEGENFQAILVVSRALKNETIYYSTRLIV